MSGQPRLLVPPVGAYVALAFEVTGYTPTPVRGGQKALWLRAVDLSGRPAVLGVGWVPDRPVCLWDVSSVILSQPGDLRNAGVPNDPYVYRSRS